MERVLNYGKGRVILNSIPVSIPVSIPCACVHGAH